MQNDQYFIKHPGICPQALTGEELLLMGPEEAGSLLND